MILRQSIKLLNEVIISFGIELGWDSYRDVGSVAFKGAAFAHDFYIFVIYFLCVYSVQT